MDRVAVFVDAGYVFAQGSVLLAGKKLPRGEIALDHAAAVAAFAGFAETVSGVRLLRVYWYDGTSTGPTAQHLTLAHLDSVKVRLGFVNSVGEQKGVDSLIVTDMIALARNRAISDAVLVSGDEDPSPASPESLRRLLRRPHQRCWRRRRLRPLPEIPSTFSRQGWREIWRTRSWRCWSGASRVSGSCHETLTDSCWQEAGRPLGATWSQVRRSASEAVSWSNAAAV